MRVKANTQGLAEWSASRRLKRPLWLACVLALTCALPGCVETLPQPVANVDKPGLVSIAPRPGVSPSGASIAFVSLAGAPENVRKQLGDAMTAEVGRRKLTLAAADAANYLIRGNISAASNGKATIVTFVWDIYGADKNFRRRLQDSVTIAAAAQDGWSVVTAPASAQIASRSVGELAAFLTHTPEAVAAAGQTGKPVPPAAAGNALAFAPLR